MSSTTPHLCTIPLPSLHCLGSMQASFFRRKHRRVSEGAGPIRVRRPTLRDSATCCRRRSGVRHHYERGDTQRAHELHELALDLTEPPRTNGSHRPTHRVNGNPNGHSSQRQPSAERRGTAANKPLSQRILSVEPTWLLRALTDTIRWILSVEPPTASLAGGITTFKFTSLSVSALSTFGLQQIHPYL